MRKIPPLNALKAFEVSGRHLNFRLAAEELGVTQGAVAQQVRGLEDYLNVRLFLRQARGLSLTSEGQRYLPSLSRAFEMIAEATENLRPSDMVLTVSTTPTFASRWLVPRLGEFTSDHPDIRVRLDASNALANFQTDGVDIAIRQGKPPFGPGLVADPLFVPELIAVCHPDLASGRTAISSPDDLRHHVLLQDAHGQWPQFLETAFRDKQIPRMRTMNFSQTSLAIDAAMAGQGVALTNTAFVETELKSNQLCQPFPFSICVDKGYYVVAPRTPRKPQVVAIGREWLLRQA